METTVASFAKEVTSGLAKRPLVFNGRLANRGLTFLVKEATGNGLFMCVTPFLGDQSITEDRP